MAQQQAVPFFHDPDANVDQGAKDLSVTFNFTSAAPVIANAVTLAETGLFTLQCLYIDNSTSPAPTSIMFAGTRQVVTAAPFTQGYYRVLGSPLMLDYVATNYGGAAFAGGVNVTVHFLNIVPDGAMVWSVNSPSGQQGTSAAASSSGANTALSATLANVPGRRLYISTVELTAAGSTAGAAVNATLTNLDNAGVAQTLNWTFVFPVGVLAAATPLIVNFSPPIPILLGANAVLTLPAGGAGNTAAAISIDGFWI